ncbi:MAG: methyltransferase domain-containing protein [Gaiellaceae bacterium]|jgi:ubiquinone/menaquinone biosynthesis C-methylase UbiE
MSSSESPGTADDQEQRNEVVRARFASVAGHFAERAREQAPLITERARRLLAPLRGDERALDAGTGAGALALGLAPLVGEVIGCDIVPELLAAARKLAVDLPNVSFVEGDIFALPFETGSFDIAGTIRTLHHLERPEKAIPELVRVLRPNGRLLVIDQLAPLDPPRAMEIDRFERARDPSHVRTLSDQDMRGLFDMNGLTLLRQEIVVEQRDLEQFLDGAGCEGEERERVKQLAPAEAFTVELGWYVLERRV